MDFISKIVGLASDHAGYALKEIIKSHLEKSGFRVVDFGAYNAEKSDYPDFAHPLCQAFERNELEVGIALCGTGNGMVVTLNKYACIRAGLAWNVEVARLIRAHNKANILVLPARYITPEESITLVDAFLVTPFDGGRHLQRVEKIVTNHANNS